MRKTQLGFTLIELLIVVAIIAILAAIAVPNFLEAQVRAKVARARTDLRTLATGVEAYSVDYNKYPLNMLVDQNTNAEADPWGGVPNIATQPTPATNSFHFSRKNSLTTPISYLTNYMPDVFYRIVPGSASGNSPIRAEYQWTNAKYGATTQATIDTFEVVYGGWRMWSGGPDADRRDILLRSPFTEAMRVYDPTNGSVSRGDIWRTQKNQDGRRPTIPGLVE